jgi:hypothetical protein
MIIPFLQLDANRPSPQPLLKGLKVVTVAMHNVFHNRAGAIRNPVLQSEDRSRADWYSPEGILPTWPPAERPC